MVPHTDIVFVVVVVAVVVVIVVVVPVVNITGLSCESYKKNHTVIPVY